MYKLFKAVQYSSDRRAIYYITRDNNKSNSNDYDLFYDGWMIHVYIQTSIYMSTNKQRRLVNCYKKDFSNEISYEELLELINYIVEAPNNYTPQILDLLNSILINWNVVN